MNNWTEITKGLPNKFMKVKCQHKSSPGFCLGTQHYYFNPSDASFRTPKGRNKTKRIHAWIPA